MTSQKKFIHDLKGPAILSPTEIKDIVESRAEKGARKDLAKKYGISEKRVLTIWKEYYGGGTLKDYASGLKKELPNSDVKTKDINMRRIKTERAQYSAKEPKVKDLDKPDTRASSIRKIPVKIDRELQLDPKTMDDHDAEVVAGQIQAGNDSSELIAVMTELINSNKQLSESAIKSLKLARETVKKRNKNTSDNIYSQSENDTDDSTTIYKPKKKQTKFVSPDISEYTEESEYETESEEGDRFIQYANDISGARRKDARIDDSRCNAAISIPIQRVPDMDRHMEFDQGLRLRPTGHTGRAKPIYKTGGERAEYDEESGYNFEDSRYEQEIPSVKHNSRKNAVQSNNSHFNNKFNKEPRESQRISGKGRVGPIENMEKIPWFKPRPI